MANVIIWHNPRCRKSREGLNYLKEKGIEPEIYDYMKQGINPEELAAIIRKSGLPVEEFVRSNEKEYRELGLKGRQLSPEEFARIAAEHPRLLQRPIIIKGDTVVLGRPVSRIDAIFQN